MKSETVKFYRIEWYFDDNPEHLYDRIEVANYEQALNELVQWTKDLAAGNILRPVRPVVAHVYEIVRTDEINEV